MDREALITLMYYGKQIIPFVEFNNISLYDAFILRSLDVTLEKTLMFHETYEDLLTKCKEQKNEFHVPMYEMEGSLLRDYYNHIDEETIKLLKTEEESV